ncbi:MAG: hypothetical protein IIB00_02495 [candidate division Zixibacteria bacterium]|nr:hypothetical protein [candidate division Zixibacteria bacterium]
MEKSSEKYTTWACAALVGVLTLLHFVSLESDPPMHFIGHGQAQLTYPYHLTFSARNSILHGDWNPYDYHRWDVFKNSLVSGFSYRVFSVAGVSRLTANLSAVLLHLGGLALFAFGLLKWRSKLEVWLTLCVLMLNTTLFFYGRLPFLENGLIFLSGLTFWIFSRYYHKVWGLISCGVVIALATLAGKLFGLLLLAPAIVTIVYIYRRNSLRYVSYVLAGLAIGIGLYVIIFYGGSFAVMLSYYREQTTGLYGLPPGLLSLSNFLIMIFTFGGESGLIQFSPFLFVLSAISVVGVFLSFNVTSPHKSEMIPIVFCLGWLIIGALGLSPFLYRPIRYTLFLILPSSALVGYFVKQALDGPLRFELNRKWFSLGACFILFWHLYTQVWMIFSPVFEKFKSGSEFLPKSALIAFVTVGALYIWLRRPRRISSRISLTFIGAIILPALFWQGQYFASGLTSSGHYLQRYNKYLTEFIAKDAVISGPYAPALTIDNDLRGVIYSFGLTNIEKNFFERFPVTHIVADVSNMKRARADFPQLKSAKLLARMPVRNATIDLYRVANTGTALTIFEEAVILLSRGQGDSAVLAFDQFLAENPENLYGQLYRSASLFATGRIEESIASFERIAKSNSDDYMVHSFCGGYFSAKYQDTGISRYKEIADRHLKIVKDMSPALVK